MSFYAQLMDERVSVDVVKPVARRNGRSAVIENLREVGILPIKVKNVRAKMSLLQQIAGSGKIVNPQASLRGPRLIAIEPLAIRPKCQAGCFLRISQRLVRRLMNHKAVDA